MKRHFHQVIQVMIFLSGCRTSIRSLYIYCSQVLDPVFRLREYFYPLFIERFAGLDKVYQQNLAVWPCLYTTKVKEGPIHINSSLMPFKQATIFQFIMKAANSRMMPFPFCFRTWYFSIAL